MNDQSSQPDQFNLPTPVAEPQQPVPLSVNDQPVQQVSSTQPAPQIQDSDMIEPEWVNKVEQTMRRSINDPYQLSQEFSQLKETYIAGRYGMSFNPKSQDK